MQLEQQARQHDLAVKDLSKIVIDTTVQEKAITFPPMPSCSTGRA
jgi:hypothetical protein